MTTFLDKIAALLAASKFSAFMDGVEVKFTDGSTTFAKIQSSSAVKRGMGLCFSRFSYRTEMYAGQIIETGYGEDDSRLIAFEKSVAESLERLVFRLIKNKGAILPTTSGWACHNTVNKCEQVGREELAERDAVLNHWLKERPMAEVDTKTFPSFLKYWISSELSQHKKLSTLRILVTDGGFAPAVVLILEDAAGFSVCATATSRTFDGAVKKALSEACRLASNLEKGFFLESSKILRDRPGFTPSPEDHGLLYSYHEKLPSWLFGTLRSWKHTSRQWRNDYAEFNKQNFHFDFRQLVASPLVVGYAISNDMQPLYFGSTKAALAGGVINFKRLELKNGQEPRNLLPHFIS